MAKTVTLTEDEALLIQTTLAGAVEQLLPLRHTDPDVLTVVGAYNQILDSIKAQLGEEADRG